MAPSEESHSLESYEPLFNTLLPLKLNSIAAMKETTLCSDNPALPVPKSSLSGTTDPGCYRLSGSNVMQGSPQGGQAAALVVATPRIVYRLVDSGTLDFTDSEKGLVLVCARSLAVFVRRHSTAVFVRRHSTPEKEMRFLEP